MRKSLAYSIGWAAVLAIACSLAIGWLLDRLTPMWISQVKPLPLALVFVLEYRWILYLAIFASLFAIGLRWFRGEDRRERRP